LGAHGCNADSKDNVIMKLWIVLAFIGIAGSLLAAGFFMVRGGPQQQDKAQRMANALAWRIGLSVALFVCLILAYAMGWIKPTGIPMGA
jgi:CHASE2 domain-containing sensor protein